VGHPWIVSGRADLGRTSSATPRFGIVAVNGNDVDKSDASARD
jgi:hypothetical protein